MEWETGRLENVVEDMADQTSAELVPCKTVYRSTLSNAYFARPFPPELSCRCVISGMYQGKSDLGGLSYVSAYQLSSRSAQISIEWHLAHLAHLGSGEQRKVLRSLRVKTSWVMLARSWATPVREIGRKQVLNPRYQLPTRLPRALSSPGIPACKGSQLRSCRSAFVHQPRVICDPLS